MSARDAKELKDDKDEMIANLTGQLEELKGQMADLMKSAKTKGSHALHEAAEVGEGFVENARGQARKALDAASHSAEDLREHASHYISEADRAIRQNPATAVGVAVGVGLLIGALWARK